MNYDPESRLISDLYAKHNFPVPKTPVVPDQDFLQERWKFLNEELVELLNASMADDLSGIIDALVDIVYVAKGTAVLLGLSWSEHFTEVHRANLEKIPGINDKRPGLKNDLIKPNGWTPPDHWSIISRVINEGR